jgi:3'-5' exoribonuclease
MKGPFVSELEPKQTIASTFLVQAKDVRQKKTGEPYLSLTLADRTGDLGAKMWDGVADVLETFDRDDFVHVKGETLLYQNRLQLNIHRLIRVDDAAVDLADFLPVSRRDPAAMFTELLGVIEGFGNAHLKALLQALFADPVIAAGFRRAPAAKGIHHAWLGGLIEHVLSLTALARHAAAHYRFIDLDLLLTGVVLHDIGKIEELRYERSFSYSSDGQLLGHIHIGLRMVAEKLRLLPDFPPRLRALVEHMILSHHGQLEFGSPKVPLFAEALLLHHLDNLDSKMEALRAALERERVSESEWTAYNYALDRSLLDKEKYLNPPPPREAPKPPPAAAARPARPVSGTLFGEQLSSALHKEK